MEKVIGHNQLRLSALNKEDIFIVEEGSGVELASGENEREWVLQDDRTMVSAYDIGNGWFKAMAVVSKEKVKE